MSVRAKFKCTDNNESSVTLQAVTSGSPENESFFEATPNGQIRMSIVNDAALKQFEAGKEYYVDFSPAN